MIHPREIAYCGVFGAAALLLPLVFHLFHLGHVFMPMYLPLVTLGFFVRPLPAGLTALLAPLLSGAATGMPPFYPPVGPIMSIELAVMSSLISALRLSFPRLHDLAILVPVLLLGRCIGVGLIYAAARCMQLPAKFIAGASLLSGWPGIILMIAVIPAILRISRKTGGLTTHEGARHV
ncbi:MAG: hypothetical protein A2268_14575 [Candidatus Raymondbacteria bacterium RifOxyA12_full_50_37]|uniref:ECF transporter S component n=1 Tax=Candidatus Raymondbacteria bacterium RIFOXYD12_FULL_49_13 TaxID=1817890 RepID=A0A1F7F2T3_UNCRA|nr:MAG: hypothetical protein A2268_14575 [Candidatus Raymondbacteria bacterium RifOxyA12_full_50_37]OGJ88644.1 MAG: hypothetical protein A2248_20510 [Candidatus Raymondbacteria bacterium RIFOXYA2_FULL_49_16]OGJ90504.1 MAG: hypothetical protein A2350_18640 [Candidatus Raymondbacteria bacterium RifOxyB12_full_50_8]OGK00816.1 MAG: hypothetical protein A2519_07765 [Candidatus Raymondbacteria bacterium RIFOXYD12_FULL_49_13]OGK02881.1 MAG: hypothetical protein A2487_17800 [Candidatus Raymondbacteria 